MAKVLDLNSSSYSIMDLTLQDPERTVVHLDFPSEALVNQLEAMQPELRNIAKGDQTAVLRIYDLAANLINCNLDCFQTTGQELRGRYRMHVLAALQFFSGYLDAIHEIANGKN